MPNQIIGAVVREVDNDGVFCQSVLF